MIVNLLINCFNRNENNFTARESSKARNYIAIELVSFKFVRPNYIFRLELNKVKQSHTKKAHSLRINQTKQTSQARI